MDPNYHTAAAIFHRFRRAMLTDDQPVADQWFSAASEFVPIVQEEFGDDLMGYEILLLAGLLANLRLVQALKTRIADLSAKLYTQPDSNSSNSSSSSE